jgi:hypothetical protein
VLAGQLRTTELWGRPCLGYLLLLLPDPEAAAALAAVQDGLLAVEPALLRQPAHAMHITAGALVPVLAELDRQKDEIWRQYGAGWSEVIATAAAATPVAPLRFRRLMMTDAAIIAVAEEPNPISELRRRLEGELDLPWPLSKGELVHCTLLRYREHLPRPEPLARAVASAQYAVDTGVTELIVVRETTFPCLDFEVCERFGVGRPRQ